MWKLTLIRKSEHGLPKGPKDETKVRDASKPHDGSNVLPKSLSSRQVDNCFGLICIPFPSSKGQCI